MWRGPDACKGQVNIKATTEEGLGLPARVGGYPRRLLQPDYPGEYGGGGINGPRSCRRLRQDAPGGSEKDADQIS